jgi:hypothetical protein
VGGRLLGPGDAGPSGQDQPEQGDGAAQGRQPGPVMERRADRVGQKACLGNRQPRGRQAQRDADREVKPGSPSDPEEAGIDGPQAPAPVSSGGIWFTPIRRRNTQ